jgi:hypothetical protein
MFIKIFNDVVVPFFPGTRILNTNPVIPQYNGVPLVAQIGQPRNLRVIPYKGARFGIEVQRSQAFSSEEKILMDFLIKYSERLHKVDIRFYNETVSSIHTEAVSSFILNDSDFFYNLLLRLSEWALYTYEGQKISTSIGIVNGDNLTSDIHFDNIAQLDFAKVLGNGHDSLMLFDLQGKFYGYQTVKFDETTATGYYPIRFIHLAGWAQQGNTCVTLTRSGDILVFKNGNLLFAKRMGAWTYYSHEIIQKQFTSNAIAKNTLPVFRRALYDTALDLSYSKTGGCIGVINLNKVQQALQSGIVDVKERFNVGSDDLKVRLLEKVINKTPFHQLNRLLRLEIASIDGATVLDRQGNYITAGSILQIPGGSTGGGRTAATKALSKFGIGIKISNDGYIEAYDRNEVRLFRLGLPDRK